MPRPVTERDLRAPEFADCEPEDMELLDDGRIVRRDRWQSGLKNMLDLLGVTDEDAGMNEAIDRIRDLQEAAGKLPDAQADRATLLTALRAVKQMVGLPNAATKTINTALAAIRG